MIELLACPICGAKPYAFRAWRSRQVRSFTCNLVRCSQCSHIFMSPVLTQDELQPFYGSSYHVFSTAAKTGPALKEWIDNHLNGDVLNHAAIVVGGRYLDVGCGLGDMVEAMSMVGMRSQGLDPSIAAVNAALRLGREVVQGSSDRMPFANCCFDTITLYHSLEHTSDPLRVLIECRRVLRESGEIVVAVPNSDSIVLKMLGSTWTHLSWPTHLHHFSQESLSVLCERAGLRFCEVCTESLVPSVVGDFAVWMRRRLFVPQRLSRRSGLLTPVARMTARFADPRGQGDAIVAHLRRA